MDLKITSLSPWSLVWQLTCSRLWIWFFCALQVVPSLPAFVESVRQLYSKPDASKVTPQLSSFPSVGSDPERQQVLALLENWVRVCHEIAQTPTLSTDKCRGFLTTLYAQVIALVPVHWQGYVAFVVFVGQRLVSLPLTHSYSLPHPPTPTPSAAFA